MTEEKMLTSVLHSVQMGQSGIRCVMDKAVNTELKQELKRQLQNYDVIESETIHLGTRLGYQLKDINPAILRMSEMMARLQLMGRQRDSKIAGMLIQGNTRGVILGSKNLHHTPTAKDEVRMLTQRLVAQEKSSMEQSQRFL